MTFLSLEEYNEDEKIPRKTNLLFPLKLQFAILFRSEAVSGKEVPY